MLAIDPGGTTGLFYDGPIAGHRVQEYMQLSGADHHNPLWDLLTRYHASAYASGIPLVLIYERFEFKKSEQDREKIEYISKEYEGVVKLFAQKNVGHQLQAIGQGSAHAVGKTAFWGDGPGGNEKIKRLGMYVSGMKHAMDALRHYLYWYSFTRGDKFFIMQLKASDAH